MRDGDLATGQYNVLLPDGRKQVRNMKYLKWDNIGLMFKGSDISISASFMFSSSKKNLT